MLHYSATSRRRTPRARSPPRSPLRGWQPNLSFRTSGSLRFVRVTLYELSAVEQRVLGCLLEKEVTVPASYPCTVHTVRTACNQSSSREPVVDYDEPLVQDTLRALQAKELVAVTWADSGRRTLKYAQRLVARLALPDDQRALLTVLLLRGPQAPGALRSRTERLHVFADRSQVESCLQAMASRQPPLARELPRRAREQDARWVHLLGTVELAESAPPPAVDREAVLADGGQARDERVRRCYASVAGPYAEALTGELDQLPFERWLLERVGRLAGRSPVVEVGCGPGHVTAFLARAGVQASGLDVTSEMIEQARARFPEVDYEVGDLRQLMRPPAHDGWGAVLAWYSLIHLAPSELAGAVSALVRTLRPDGVLVLALHAGHGVRSATEWFDRTVDVDVVLYEAAEIVELVQVAGLVDVEWYRRGPLTSRSETSERLYVLARRPA